MTQTVRHRSLESCMASFFGCSIRNLPKRGYWKFYNRQGKRCHQTMKRTLRLRSKLGCWGYVQHQQHRIHLWVAPDCQAIALISLLAHELGHLQPPRGSSRQEELKAGRYEAVTSKAIELAAKFVTPIHEAKG